MSHQNWLIFAHTLEINEKDQKNRLKTYIPNLKSFLTESDFEGAGRQKMRFRGGK